MMSIMYEENIALTIHMPLGVFEHIRMEQENKKGETFLLQCQSNTNMIVPHRL